MPLTKPGASEMNNPRDNSGEPGYAAAIAAAPLGEPRWWRPQHAVHRYVGVGTYRAACLSAASGDAGPWEELIARALAAPPPNRPVPGGPVYHLRAGEQVALVAGHDLSGPLYELITAVLALGEAPS
jgi:hypothetical protein